MSDQSATVSTKPSPTDLEVTLSQVRGIYASSVILDPQRDLSEIHIVSSTERKPKQIVRDIETLLFVKHRVKVDYRKISLVQLPDENLLRLPVARPEIRRVTEENLRNQKRIRVEIQSAGRTAVGEAKEKTDNPDLFRTAAQATINAIEKLLNHAIDVHLDDASSFRLGSHEVLLVILTCLIEGCEETFAGAAFLGSHPAESGARATLDALNRRIHNLPIQPPRQAEADV
jgi:hypothetical protein